MLYPLDDTIVAIASSPGGGARGILRLSGPGVRACVEEVFQPDPPLDLAKLRVPTAIPGAVRTPRLASPLPCDVYIWPTGRSYTGQPVGEIHTIGSPPLLEAILAVLCQAGARLAQPGEFTLRAFLSGRLDLTQAEAVLGVIDAADPRQLDVALGQLAGGLSGPLDRLRDRLLDLLARIEAGLDFSDEEIAFISREELARQLDAASESVAELRRQMAARGSAGDRVRIVLMGWPNTGKSSLFNALAGGRHALVSHLPGTTRDYLTGEVVLHGVTCLLIDTAGVESADLGDLHSAAQAATAEQAQQAQIRLLCLDASRSLNDWERLHVAEDDPQRLIVWTKADLGRITSDVDAGRTSRSATKTPATDSDGLGTDLEVHPTDVSQAIAAIETSSVTGLGIEALKSRLGDAVAALGGASAGEVIPSTAARSRESFRLAAESLHRAGEILKTGGGEELIASELRVVLDELGKIVGAVYTEDLLDRIFSRFCIGK